MADFTRDLKGLENTQTPEQKPLSRPEKSRKITLIERPFNA